MLCLSICLSIWEVKVSLSRLSQHPKCLHIFVLLGFKKTASTELPALVTAKSSPIVDEMQRSPETLPASGWQDGFLAKVMLQD